MIKKFKCGCYINDIWLRVVQCQKHIDEVDKRLKRKYPDKKAEE